VTGVASISKVLVVSDLPIATSLWGRSNTLPFNFVLELNPDQGVRRYTELLPDLIILELGCEPLAIELVMKFRDETTTPVLMLSSICSNKFILDAYQAGVDEYILKPIQPEILLAKIKAWLRRSQVIPQGLLDSISFNNGKLMPAERSILIEDWEPVHLTSLELRLLYCLIGRRGYTVTSEELCLRIWGKSGGDVVRLKNVVYRLRRKIEADPANPRYLLTVTGVGYQFKSSSAKR